MRLYNGRFQRNFTRPRNLTCFALLFVLLVAGHLAAQTDRDSKRTEGQRLTAEGGQLFNQGTQESLNEAVAKNRQAIAIFDSINYLPGKASALDNIGTIYLVLGQKDKALQHFSQALAIARESKEDEPLAFALDRMGRYYADAGDPEKALEWAKQSVPYFISSGNSAEGTVIFIGSVYRQTGEPRKGLAYFNELLAQFDSKFDPHARATILLTIGSIHWYSNEPPEALSYYSQVLPLFQQMKDQKSEAVVLNNIGTLYTSFGQFGRARRFLERALALITDPGERATTLINLGQLAILADDWDDGREKFIQAKTIFHNLNDHSRELTASGNICTSYPLDREKQGAVDCFVRYLGLVREAKDNEAIISTLINLGVFYRDLGNREKAQTSLDEALSLAVAGKHTGDEATIRRILARFDVEDGNLRAALAKMEAVQKIIESTRAKMGSDDLRTAYFSIRLDYIQFYLDILMRLSKEPGGAEYGVRAFETSERARARALLELLASSGVDLRQGVDPELLARERSVRAQLNAKAQAQLNLSGRPRSADEVQSLAREIETLTVQLQQTEGDLRAKSPNYTALTEPRPLSLKEIQSQVLDQETLLLEYSLGDEDCYVWAVTHNSIKSFDLPKRAEIEIVGKRYYDLLNARNEVVNGESSEQRRRRITTADAQLPAAAAALSRMVLGPVAAELGSRRLAIVTDGILQYIPFAALNEPSADPKAAPQPLVVKHEIVNLPSASTLSIIRRQVAGRQPAPKSVIALADPVFMGNDARVSRPASSVKPNNEPPSARREALKLLLQVQTPTDVGPGDAVYIPRLPGTRKEAQAILALAPADDSRIALDFAANRELATSAEMSQYRYVHISTHGFLNSAHPELSGVVFSLVNEKGEAQEGFLRSNEVYNLRLPADLVVLSACQTGIGKEVKGEGLVSLTRGFMYAGAPRVVVSLWAVSDDGTGELMTRFYRGILKEKLTPAAALRAAQISLLKEKKWSSPYYWAPFVLQGEWR